MVQALAPWGTLIHGVRPEWMLHHPDGSRTDHSDGRLEGGTR